jgi:hypothetical protein
MRRLRAGLGSKIYRPPALGGELESGLYLHLVFIQRFPWEPELALESRELGSFCLLWVSFKEGK